MDSTKDGRQLCASKNMWYTHSSLVAIKLKLQKQHKLASNCKDRETFRFKVFRVNTHTQKKKRQRIVHENKYNSLINLLMPYPRHTRNCHFMVYKELWHIVNAISPTARKRPDNDRPGNLFWLRGLDRYPTISTILRANINWLNWQKLRCRMFTWTETTRPSTILPGPVEISRTKAIWEIWAHNLTIKAARCKTKRKDK